MDFLNQAAHFVRERIESLKNRDINAASVGPVPWGSTLQGMHVVVVILGTLVPDQWERVILQRVTRMDQP